MYTKTKQLAYIAAIAMLSATALYLAAPFLIPVVLAALLAMLLVRISDWLERKGMSRAGSSATAVLLFIGAIALLGIILTWQLGQLTSSIDEMKERLASGAKELRDWVSDTVGISIDDQNKMIEEQTSQASGQANALLMSFVNSLANIVVNAVLIVVYIWLFLYYRDHLKQFFLRIVPQDKRKNAQAIIQKSEALSGHYLTGLFSMIAMLWVMYGIGFWIVGLQGAVLFAIICGILEIVPFLGNLIGNLIAIFAALVQGGDLGMIVGIVAVYLTVQFLQTYVLEPLVVGQQVNINPLFTIMGLVAGEFLWGIAGMALAIPVIGIVKIVCDNVPGLQAYGMLIGPANTPKKRPSLTQVFKRKAVRSN
ncbi:AI-2E family transporter [Parapedobacter sp. 10938]|uniref:AI-2E family transporter n=1 Tax=Parapedobacter flavus TaxID=3110225 RepID=UPI002DB59FAA|nr:AI-2E family transporter [Parapedobacter sp. 10938]MEC3878675.1 AI-2E family transporter [Parapedobacter sp. 10938]